MPSAYGALTETVGCRLVGPTPRTPTGFGYADGNAGTPTAFVTMNYMCYVFRPSASRAFPVVLMNYMCYVVY